MDIAIEFSQRWYVDDVPVTIHFGEIDGRLAPIRVEVGVVFEGETRDAPPKPITTGVWRRIPVTRLADRALLEFARDLREQLETLPHPVPPSAATERLLDVSEPRKKRPGRPRLMTTIIGARCSTCTSDMVGARSARPSLITSTSSRRQRASGSRPRRSGSVASTWTIRRAAKDGSPRYRVEFRLGGREAPTRYGGSFKTKREADERKRWIAGELAARRVPDLGALEAPDRRRRYARPRNAGRNRASTLPSRPGYSTAVAARDPPARRHPPRRRLLRSRRRRPHRRAGEDTPEGDAPEDDRSRWRCCSTMPVSSRTRPAASSCRSSRNAELQPPTAAHLEAVHRLLPSRYRLPLLILDATGMRLGELEV